MPLYPPSERNSRLMRELARREVGLREWISRCTVNAIWYVCDPVDAIRAANLGIDEAILCEMESDVDAERGDDSAAPRSK